MGMRRSDGKRKILCLCLSSRYWKKCRTAGTVSWMETEKRRTTFLYQTCMRFVQDPLYLLTCALLWVSLQFIGEAGDPYNTHVDMQTLEPMQTFSKFKGRKKLKLKVYKDAPKQPSNQACDWWYVIGDGCVQSKYVPAHSWLFLILMTTVRALPYRFCHLPTYKVSYK